MDDDPDDDPDYGRPVDPSMLAEFERNAAAFAESIENNPWVHEWRLRHRCS
jgi:hypothetical protein